MQRGAPQDAIQTNAIASRTRRWSAYLNRQDRTRGASLNWHHM